LKICEQFGHAPTNSGLRKRRMEALLSAWRPQPAWLPTDALSFVPAPPDEAKFSPDEWKLWTQLLRDSEPILPHSARDGAEVRARLSGLRIDDLVQQRTLSVIGKRVAGRWLGANSGLGGYDWSVLVHAPSTADDNARIEALLRRRFGEVSPTPDGFLASGPFGPYLDTLPVLLGSAAGDSTTLIREWRLARALHTDEPFLRQLSSEARRVLATALSAELLDAAGELDVRTDTTLLLFGEGRGDEVLGYYARAPLPASRLCDLLTAEGWLEHLHHGIGCDYFEDVAAAYALIADAFPLGETLKRLPPGRAFFAAIDRISLLRPELIATFVWHPAFHAEGAFALLQLPQQRQLPQAQIVDLTDEWVEVQRLGRELLILGDRVEDWPSIVALGIHDESEAIARRNLGVRAALLQRAAREDDERRELPSVERDELQRRDGRVAGRRPAEHDRHLECSGARDAEVVADLIRPNAADPIAAVEPRRVGRR